MTAPPADSRAVRAALKGHEPSSEQWEAIAHPLVPAFLIAGAGAGKTAVMAARIVWAVEERGYAPSQILGLTFTNKAAQELEERVGTALSHLPQTRPNDITVSTYNAFAASMVRDHGLLAGIEPESGLLTEAQQWQLVLSCLDDLPAFQALELRSSAGIVRAALALASSISDHLIGISDVEAAADRILAARERLGDEVVETAQKRKELCRVVDAYQKAKRRASRIDFGDQVAKAVEILESHPEVAQSYRELYPVLLLDEYQDTNVAQRRLIQSLVEPGGAVTAVGDARQAIYAFRGATMYNLIGFPDHFPRDSGADYGEISLSENFRSGSRILAAANHIVERIPAERRPGRPLSSHPANGEGEVLLGLFSDEQTEARWIASECERLHGSVVGPGRESVRFKDIAILVRRRAAMGALVEALEERDIPVEVVGLGGLLKSPEVLEVVAWLRSLDTKPAANRWVARILLGPRWRVHYRDLGLLARWASERNHELRKRLAGGDEELARDLAPGDVGFALTEALDHLDAIEGLGPQARRRLESFAAKLAQLRSRANAPLLDLVEDVIATSGIEDALRSSTLRTARAARQNLSSFLDYVSAFAPVEGDAGLRSFLAYLDAAEEADESLDASQPAEQDSVKLMTVHSAKGLEFECVFVPSVAARENRAGDKVDSIFPNKKASSPLTSYIELPYEVREDARFLPSSTMKPQDFAQAVKERAVEDERRLFYVALTRAKQRLAVTAAWWYGREKRPRGPSEFWDELAALEGEVAQVVERVEQPPQNPLIEVLERGRAWPPQARSGAEDPVFPEGWGQAAQEVVAAADLGPWLQRLDSSDDRSRAEAALSEHRKRLARIARARSEGPPEPGVPRVLSATAFVRLQAGELDVWDLIRPLPERPTPARRLGTEVHRLIQEGSLGISPYPEEAELDEPAPAADPGGPGAIAFLMDAYRDMGFADRRVARLPSGEPMAELPFALRVGDRIVRGRIDAVYALDDGGLEIVDFKTGRKPESLPDVDQLGLYARALQANGLIPRGARVVLTYAYLASKELDSRAWDGSIPV